jgi:hypothetical protein
MTTIAANPRFPVKWIALIFGFVIATTTVVSLWDTEPWKLKEQVTRSDGTLGWKYIDSFKTEGDCKKEGKRLATLHRIDGPWNCFYEPL